MIKIENLQDPRVQSYSSLRNQNKFYRESELFIAEGFKVIDKLLDSKLEIVSFFATLEFYQNLQARLDSKGVPENQRYFAEKQLLEQIVGFNLHQGILALARQPEKITLHELSSPVVVLNGIIDTENIGSIVRNCAAFGIKSLIVDEKSASPYIRRAVRVSMGTVFDIDVYYSQRIFETIDDLKNLGYAIISCEITDKALDINTFKFPEKFTLIFGSEGQGIDTAVLNLSDLIVKIPLADGVASLNVAASTAVFLFKIMK
ncbi:MAG: putative SpoU-like rRNA methylase [Ignavibacteria bacterium]|nr:putative SpoU-like rRNA methylase [Ignavibacteria bacterium]